MAATGYPKLGLKSWSTLRARAATTPSTRFTSTAVAAMLGMGSPESAATNVVYPMQRLGLIDDSGSLTARGNKWRLDASYADACQEILDEIYSAELASFTDSSGAPDKSQVITWFQHKGFGVSNAKQLATTYVMIAEKKVPDATAAESKKKVPARPAKSVPTRTVKSKATEDVAAQRAEPPPQSGNESASGPNIHLDIQIHIPADASSDQIEKIFASMAKYLYQK